MKMIKNKIKLMSKKENYFSENCKKLHRKIWSYKITAVTIKL